MGRNAGLYVLFNALALGRRKVRLVVLRGLRVRFRNDRELMDLNIVRVGFVLVSLDLMDDADRDDAEVVSMLLALEVEVEVEVEVLLALIR